MVLGRCWVCGWLGFGCCMKFGFLYLIWISFYFGFWFGDVGVFDVVDVV